MAPSGGRANLATRVFCLVEHPIFGGALETLLGELHNISDAAKNDAGPGTCGGHQSAPAAAACGALQRCCEELRRLLAPVQAPAASNSDASGCCNAAAAAAPDAAAAGPEARAWAVAGGHYFTQTASSLLTSPNAECSAKHGRSGGLLECPRHSKTGITTFVTAPVQRISPSTKGPTGEQPAVMTAAFSEAAAACRQDIQRGLGRLIEQELSIHFAHFRKSSHFGTPLAVAVGRECSSPYEADSDIPDIGGLDRAITNGRYSSASSDSPPTRQPQDNGDCCCDFDTSSDCDGPEKDEDDEDSEENDS